MSRQKCPSTRTAFTLVELLVVIGIIALLISILLPSLAKARGAASSLRCQSNLRSVGQAIILYAGDQRGAVLPVYSIEPAAGGATQAVYWPILLVRSRYAPQGNKIANANAGREYGTVFACPNAPEANANVWTLTAYPNLNGGDGMQRYAWAPTDGSPSMWIDCGYAINGSDNRKTDPESLFPANAVSSLNDRRPGYKVTDVRNASAMLMLVDGAGYNILNHPYRIAANRHSGKDFKLTKPWESGRVNVLFYDGHAETVDRKQLPRTYNDIGKTGYTWPAIYVSQR